MKKLIAATALGVGMIVSAPNAAAAPANPICSYLDRYPNVSAIEELVLAGVDNGIGAKRSGELIGEAVAGTCPRHMDILGQFISKWA